VAQVAQRMGYSDIQKVVEQTRIDTSK
jgi:hypothetical protein